LRISDENGSAVQVSIHQTDLPAAKIKPELPSERLLPQFPLIEQDLALAFQFPSKMLKKDVPYGKIIQAPFSIQPLKMIPRFPVPIPGIVVLTAGPIFHATFDYDLLKIVHENLAVMPDEGFQHAGFSTIEVCPVCCSLFLWWQWHIFDYVLVEFSYAMVLIEHRIGFLSFDEKLDRIQRYLPKGLTEKILFHRDKIEGELKHLTVMFPDMEGFT
jgi:hypothetical protein